jgi:hypothetical protein
MATVTSLGMTRRAPPDSYAYGCQDAKPLGRSIHLRTALPNWATQRILGAAAKETGPSIKRQKFISNYLYGKFASIYVGASCSLTNGRTMHRGHGPFEGLVSASHLAPVREYSLIWIMVVNERIDWMKEHW